MNIKEVLAPSSSDRILLVVLFWTLSSVALAQVLDQSLIRWELAIGGLLLLVWAVWAIHYRFEQAEKERYEKERYKRQR